MTGRDYTRLPRVDVRVDSRARQGLFEWWRHSLGQGGVNSTPLPERVVEGIGKLEPRLIRVFLQQYFDIYPDHGTFNWSLLDPYMDALARTGAQVLATINVKPPVLFPQVDQAVWRPNDVAEWQNVIYQLVRRYSVEKPIVTHWEHANEPDIGEQGGCPYLIPTAEENFEFYRMTARPVLEAFPEARVGGPAIAGVDSPILRGFIERCWQSNTRLDFVSWHMYNSDLDRFRAGVEKVGSYLAGFPGRRPEIMLNEWNKGFDFADPDHPSYHLVSVEEMAFAPRRAAFAAANILSLMETGLDWSHYFLIWDSCCYPGPFRPFYSAASTRQVMYRHWNETPHRFGLFSEGLEVRPQYFVYQMLSRMGVERVAARCPDPDVRVQAAVDGGKLSVLAVNYDPQTSRDLIVTIHFGNLKPGVRMLKAYRIDDDRRWSPEGLELVPIEHRTVDVLPDFACQFYSPADSVLMVVLQET
jgi:xylan 1,4-beta-xylosidase